MTAKTDGSAGHGGRTFTAKQNGGAGKLAEQGNWQAKKR
jgi:hypothetical protein